MENDQIQVNTNLLMIPILLLALLLAFPPPAAQACLHFSTQHTTEIREPVQRALLFHDGKLAHLVLQAELKAANGDLPKELAWVLPFPALPSLSEEADPKIFDDLLNLAGPWPMLGQPKSMSTVVRGIQAPQPADIRVHEAQQVGNYRLQPIEILNDRSGKALSNWLNANGFNAMPERLQKPYLKKGAVFMAIRMKLEGGSAQLKPIHFAYKSSRLSYPIRFTHDERTFDLNLYVLSRHAPKSRPSGGLLVHAGEGQTQHAGAALSKLLTVQDGKVLQGVVSLYQATGINTPGKELSQLKEDPSFHFKN